jgi:hypothetical protein
MKARIFRIVGAIGLVLAMGSLSACFESSYYPGYPGYSYGAPGWYRSPAYAYHPYPRYAPPAPHYYAYNHGYHHGWEHEGHVEHGGHGYHHDRD